MITRQRAPHAQSRFLALVATGGALGTAARAGIALFIVSDAFPLATLTVNLIGAFGLGMLLEALTRFGDDTGRRRVLRLGLGTGFFGGFTTYSTFALETSQLLSGNNVDTAIGYALVTVIAGAVATVIGVVAGAGLHRRRTSEGEAA